MKYGTIWEELRYSLFLSIALGTCILGFYFGSIGIPFDRLTLRTVPIPLFTISIALVVLYTYLYNMYYNESGFVTFIISILCMGYPFVEFRYGILLLTLQSSLVLLAYGIGLNIGSGLSILMTVHNKEESARELINQKIQNMFKA